ncbi:phosphoenolpyruvate--protein phosphotransferase [Brevibacillus humidisoli]|uniref:phosphoenolpyruvate--protein phosphotransferase n=1 Tax=Brevibacillus humidisoli TaxID=2895522 RepID=UPI001E4EADBF|nr:phosphoenolpyruvate--protein phosphotransferase [Brevibacillus humidisoli]UFJ42349.1 phosphoenolpyruvate--protein phosphotransferase [Brevibacillus humidisoli]
MTKGIAASPGYAAGPVFLLQEADLTISTESIANDAADQEWSSLVHALEQTKEDLRETKQKVAEKIGEEESAIFESHLMILDDPALTGDIQSEIENERKNAAWAVHDVFSKHAEMFASLDDPYMKERASDFRDLEKRVLKHLLGVVDASLESIQEPVILVAYDLTPSDTARLDPQTIKGIITEIGGSTSHSAILARNLQIPAVVGCPNITKQLAAGDMAALDGSSGEVILHPTADLIKQYQEKQEEFRTNQQRWKASAQELAVTADGRRVEVAANIGNPSDVKAVLDNGGEAIGLFRSEFLFLDRDTLPDEEEQFQAYRQVAEEMAGRPVIIRTLDIGGDKQVPALPMDEELNPFLGFRAIRLCLDRKELFMTQLRAILRASHYGKLRIMFPMIAIEAELKQALEVLEEAKAALKRETVPFDEQIETGIMIEVPSAAIIADQLAKHVDFFSIGSNDLIQYTFAADRMNQKVGYLYDPGHTAILRLIKQVVEHADANGIWVGVCGEMAGVPEFAKALIGIGVKELSMTASLIPQIKYEISQSSYAELEKQVREKL